MKRQRLRAFDINLYEVHFPVKLIKEVVHSQSIHDEGPCWRFAQAAMSGLLEASRAEDGASYFDSDIARQALVACLASILEADARMKTRKDTREASDRAARKLRLQLEALGRYFEATGEHLGWDASSVPLQ